MRVTQLLTLALLLATGACTLVTTASPPREDAGDRLERGLAALDAQQYRTAFDELAWVYSRCAGHERGVHALVGLAALELDPRNRAGRPDLAVDLLGRILTRPGPPQWLLPLSESAYLMALALGAPPVGPSGAALQGVPVDTMQADPVRTDTVRTDTSRADTTAADPDPADPWPAAIRDTTNAVDRSPPATPAPRPWTGEPVAGCGPATTDEDWVAPPLPTLPGPSLVSLLSQMEASRDSAVARSAALNAELEALRQRLQETEQELERIRRTLRP